MKGSISELMQQAQKMQADLQKAQEELAQAEVTGESGAGLVQVVMTGRHDVKRVSIDDSVFTEDKEVLEDLLAAAVNDAVRKVEAHNRDAMSGLAAGIQISHSIPITASGSSSLPLWYSLTLAPSFFKAIRASISRPFSSWIAPRESGGTCSP